MAHTRKTVIFNDDSHEGELKKWCDQQSSNFSGFVKSVLFAYKTNNQHSSAPETVKNNDTVTSNNDNSMDDIL